VCALAVYACLSVGGYHGGIFCNRVVFYFYEVSCVVNLSSRSCGLLGIECLWKRF